LRRLLVPAMRQSLKILTLPLFDLKTIVQEELENNPVLEELPASPSLSERKKAEGYGSTGEEFRLEQMTRKVSLQEMLLRQLGMACESDADLHIGQEIIGNIDENGYLKAATDEIAALLELPVERVETVLRLIQQFEPAGVGARSIAECLLIQLNLANDQDPLLHKIIASHLEDVARKNYTLIAKALNEPLEKVESLIKKIHKLNPKPGRDYSTEEAQQIIPDIIISQKEEEIEIAINNEDIPTVNLNKDYKDMLKNNGLDPEAKAFLAEKMRDALELLRAISKRHDTLRKVIEVIAEIQQDAIREGLASLKPLTFKEVAGRLNIHETTVCRAVMNKYVQLPWGVVALKDFFTSRNFDHNGQSVSSSLTKMLIKELIDEEDKKCPLSDEDISRILTQEKNLNVPRRTVAKYREELKILSSTFRREK